MAGLISQVQQEVPEEPSVEPVEPVEPEGESASDEEQEWYDAVQKAGAEILFNNDEASKSVLSMLNPKQPAMSCGNAAAEVILQIDRGMDGRIPESVILPASEEILDHVIDIAEAAKILTRSTEIETEAAQAMVARLADEYGIDKEDFAAAQSRVGGT